MLNTITTFCCAAFVANARSICDGLTAAAANAAGGATVLIFVVTDPVGEFPLRQSGDSARTRK